MSVDSRFNGPGPDAVWSESVREGRFTIQHCRKCRTSQFPPSVVCRSCGNPEPVFVEATGHASVYSTTTVRVREGSYNVSILTLAEGPRILSTVVGVPSGAVRIGQTVRAQIENDGTAPRIVFVPAEGEGA